MMGYCLKANEFIKLNKSVDEDTHQKFGVKHV